MNDNDKPIEDRSGMMAGAIMHALQGAQCGMVEVGETLSALSKAAAMVIASIQPEGERKRLTGTFRLQVGLDVAEVSAAYAAMAADKRPAVMDLGDRGGLN